MRNLAGLKNDSAVGFLPVIPLNPRAERALHDLRAIALRFLDVEFLTAIRPSHSEPAYMLDAGVDVIGYAAFVAEADTGNMPAFIKISVLSTNVFSMGLQRNHQL